MNQQPVNGRVEGRRGVLRVAGWSSAGLLLLLPLAAMQFTDAVIWSPADFAIFGLLLATAGGALELAARSRDPAYRGAVAVAVLTGFLLVWLSLAVGIVGEGGRADLFYLAALPVALVGAVVARFRAAGMAWALIAAALAVAIAGAAVLGGGLAPAASAPRLLGLTGMFVALFLASALLFRRASRPSAAHR